jgi:hypothetical protein
MWGKNHNETYKRHRKNPKKMIKGKKCPKVSWNKPVLNKIKGEKE